jgi:nucleoside-diphosphate-sugar epimerase
MKLLLTGSTGFIGSHLAKKLLQDGHSLVLLVLDKNEAEKIFGKNQNIEIIQSDIMHDSKTDQYFKGIDAVYHLAAIRHRWGVKAEDYLEVNGGLTQKLFEAAAKAKVKQFIFCSSISVFGWPKSGPVDESFPYTPNNAYGRSKVAGEQMVKSWSKKTGIPYTIIRPSVTYGDGDYTGMLTKLIGLIYNKKYFTIGSGQNRVQLVYIDDLTDGMAKALLNQKAFNEDFILTYKNPISINELNAVVAAATGRRLPKIHISRFLAYIPAYLLEGLYKIGLKITGSEPIISKEKIDLMAADRSYSIAKAEKLLEFKPKTDYSEGVKKVFIWNKQNKLI